MADLIIKPATGDGNKLILQDKAGGAVLTTADSGATITSATLTSPTINSPTLAGTISGTLLPTTDAAQDLGSAAKRWNNIYTTDLHLANERGNWTVIEEEDYLTLRNNKTDKVYKLVMEEIE